MQPSLLLGSETHRELQKLLRAKHELVISGAANETAKALLTSHLLNFNESGALLVTGTDMSRDGLQHWSTFFECPARAILPLQNPEGEILREHLQSFYMFLERGKDSREVFLAARDAWDSEFPQAVEVAERTIVLEKGKDVAFTELFETLLDRGYEHSDDQHLLLGQYRRMGDVLEIFPLQAAHPFRITFDVDRVERIMSFDAAERKDIGEEEEVRILPANFESTSPLGRQIPEDTVLILDDQDDIPRVKGRDLLRFTAFPESPDYHVHLRYLSVLKFYTLTDFLNDIRDKLQQGWTLIVVTKRSDELQQILTDEHVPFTTALERRQGAITLLHADRDSLLPHSLQNPDLTCALLTDREIFSLRKAGKQRSIQKLALDFITSLQAGDYVVHMEHGIGHFEGMTQKFVDDVAREYLELTYAEGDKLFVPVDQADKLSKFVHEEGQEPTLTRLGTVEWKRVTEKMQQETAKIAKELLDLYARRAKAKGFSFGADTDPMKRFEAAFPHAETPGQTQAIQEIKKDMEADRPMDRLVCGDVGFGKTEVAMRAAFKAVQAGKQVAIVAPITILADQHFRTFNERMKGFAVKIEMMSRFRTPKEQKETLRKLKSGTVDIVIGTHRLLQPDVQFKDLGLVVIDEEQRFGVKQKEIFKSMRASVDILTLTATPIPRTLNLGLHKLRDISTITTPPPGRLPIITEVRKYSDALVREAIIAEVKRGGQCYMLHNRVETIDAFASKLKALVPEARFIVAHGQLPPDDLEDRIITFKDGKADVLVSSTIIENGIDLPRANTLIVNETEHFGLSQLYQLRGRVGRSKIQAHAFFLYHTEKLHEDAKKRLRAIVEASELGSGFQISMRDLEIRGAGEVLGAHQSGTMQTVGISHYLRMLKHALEELKGETTEEVAESPTEILLHVEAYIPSFYIPENEEKISVYQKLAGSEEESILAEFAADLKEEYGEPPEQVQNLFQVLRLRMACRRSGVMRVKAEEGPTGREIVVTLNPRVTAKEIMQLLSKNPEWRISGSTLRLPENALKITKDDPHGIKHLMQEMELLEKKRK